MFAWHIRQVNNPQEWCSWFYTLIFKAVYFSSRYDILLSRAKVTTLVYTDQVQSKSKTNTKILDRNSSNLYIWHKTPVQENVS